ncbi:MAG: hypothetical protein QGF59_11300, partial [Pirellulaceae bacterium]|nr:hypothetical protein [Pirellulaceae bacterium]
IPQSYFPVSVVNPRDPVLLLIFSGRHMFDSWRLVRRSEQGYVFAGEAVSRPLVALGQTFQAGAISPDRKWFVTAQTAAKPMLAIWSTSTGKTVREVVIEGGTHGKPLNTLIRRLAFSKSGRYLSACDGDNAYLMEFKDLLDLTELTSPGNF